MTTNKKVTTIFSLPEFYDQKVIQFTFHVADTHSRYQMIIGRDLLQESGITLNFSKNVIIWEDQEVPMKEADCDIASSFFIKDSPAVEEATQRVQKILDAKI